MKERILDVIKWSLIIIIAVMAFYTTNHYIIVAGDKMTAYKMDIMTGQVWFVTPNEVRIVKEK
jgi:hypothetical protein